MSSFSMKLISFFGYFDRNVAVLTDVTKVKNKTMNNRTQTVKWVLSRIFIIHSDYILKQTGGGDL